MASDDQGVDERDEDLAMQTRCPHCLGEQYALNVIFFSMGEAGCNVCGLSSKPMTYEQWYAALKIRRAELEKGR